MATIAKPGAPYRIMDNWADSGAPLNDLGPGKEAIGYIDGEEPDPDFENLYKASIGKFMQWASDQLDENTPKVNDIVTQAGFNEIVGTKQIGDGGSIEPNINMDGANPVIRDERNTNGYQLLYLGPPNANGRSRIYARGDGLIFVENATWNNATLSWVREVTGQESSAVTLNGGKVTMSRQPSGSPDTWLVLGGWDDEGAIEVTAPNDLYARFETILVDKIVANTSTPSLPELTRTNMIKAFGSVNVSAGVYSIDNGYNIENPRKHASLDRILVDFKAGDITDAANTDMCLIVQTNNADYYCVPTAAGSNTLTGWEVYDRATNTRQDPSSINASYFFQIFSE